MSSFCFADQASPATVSKCSGGCCFTIPMTVLFISSLLQSGPASKPQSIKRPTAQKNNFWQMDSVVFMMDVGILAPMSLKAEKDGSVGDCPTRKIIAG